MLLTFSFSLKISFSIKKYIYLKLNLCFNGNWEWVVVLEISKAWTGMRSRWTPGKFVQLRPPFPDIGAFQAEMFLHELTQHLSWPSGLSKWFLDKVSGPDLTDTPPGSMAVHRVDDMMAPGAREDAEQTCFPSCVFRLDRILHQQGPRDRRTPSSSRESVRSQLQDY